MITTRAALKKLVDAVQNFGEERFINGDDNKAMERAGRRVDRAMHEATQHLDATARQRHRK